VYRLPLVPPSENSKQFLVALLRDLGLPVVSEVRA
jgi:hypothetical protein